MLSASISAYLWVFLFDRKISLTPSKQHARRSHFLSLIALRSDSRGTIYLSNERNAFRSLVTRLTDLVRLAEGGGTCDNVDQLVGNGSLSSSVVCHVECLDHVTSVLRCVVHGVPSRVDLCSVSFHQGSVHCVGQGELSQVLGCVLFLLISLESWSFSQRCFREDLHDCRLVRDSRDIGVVDDVDFVEGDSRRHNLVGDGRCICEGGDVLANLVEGVSEVLWQGSGELSLGLVSDSEDGWSGVRVGRGSGTSNLLHLSAGTLDDRRVNTTAKTLVRGDDDVENLSALWRLCLGVLEDFCPSQ